MAPVGIAAPRWLSEPGPDADVVVSTRCRLARNREGAPFPWRASERERREIAQAVLEAADGAPVFAQCARIARDGLDAEDVRKLLELRLCSADWFAAPTSPGSGSAVPTARWLIAARDGVVSLLVNEEDHVRLQAILSGLQVESCLERAAKSEREIARRIEFSQSERIGYLTTSLGNAGTGLRLSVMLHLPALAAGDRLDEVLGAAGELGCSVRGAYGEGSSAEGAIYQVSNARACFVEPARVADRVRASARYLVDAERTARKLQFGDAAGRNGLEDAARRIVEMLFAEDAAPGRLISMVSMLRLAAAERLLPVELAECAAWITIAGATPAPSPDPAWETFEAVRRTAEIRGRVRRALNERGTFAQIIAE